MKKAYWAVFLLLFLTLIGGGLYFFRSWFTQNRLEGPEAPTPITLDELISHTSEEEGASALNIAMPFYSQAPYGNWDYPWQEACEEASVLLVANLYKEMELDREEFNEELLRLVDWEIEYFGAYEHTTIEQTAEMMELQYGLKTVIHEYPTFEDIQAILNEGHLIIAPFAGKFLGNPNFRNGGPIYHMLVIKGYDAENLQIVTHDVGTRNGADYVYEWTVIENALHDWHEENMLLGDKQIIEILPP